MFTPLQLSRGQLDTFELSQQPKTHQVMTDRNTERLIELTRGKRIPIELFVHAVDGWDLATKRLVMAA